MEVFNLILFLLVLHTTNCYYQVSHDEGSDNIIPVKVFSNEVPSPYLGNNYGLIYYPVDPIEIPDKVLEYIIPFELPCITDSVLTKDTLLTWRNRIKDIKSNVGAMVKLLNGNNTGNEIASATLTQSLLDFCKKIEEEINQVEVDGKELVDRGQFLWGLLENTNYCKSEVRNLMQSYIDVNTFARAHNTMKVKSTPITQMKLTKLSNQAPPIISSSTTTPRTLVTKVINELPETTTEFDFPIVGLNNTKNPPLIDPSVLFGDMDSSPRSKRQIGSNAILNHDKLVLHLNGVSNVFISSQAPIVHSTSNGSPSERQTILEQSTDSTMADEPKKIPDYSRVSDDQIIEKYASKKVVGFSKALGHLLYATTSVRNARVVNSLYDVQIALCMTPKDFVVKAENYVDQCIPRFLFSDLDYLSKTHHKLAGKVTETKLKSMDPEFYTTRDVEGIEENAQYKAEGVIELDFWGRRNKRDVMIQKSVVCRSQIIHHKGQSQLNLSFEPTDFVVKLIIISYDDLYHTNNSTITLDSQDYELIALICPVLETESNVQEIRELFVGARRAKRANGLGDWIMNNAWKPLFGSASENDLSKIKKHVLTASEQINRISSSQKLMVAVAKKQETVLGLMKTKLTNVNTALKAMNGNIDKLGKAYEEAFLLNTKTSQSTTWLVTITTVLQDIMNHCLSMRVTLNAATQQYRTFKNIGQSGIIDLEALIPEIEANFNKLLATAPDYRRPHNWSGLRFLRGKNVVVSFSGRKMLIRVKVPMMKIDNPDTTFRILTYPLYIGNHTIQLDNDIDYLVVHKNNPKWYGLTAHDYLTCRLEAFQVCPLRFPLHTSMELTCITSLISSGKTLPNCIFNEYAKANETTFFKQISSKQWLAYITSKDANNTEYKLSCEDGAKSDSIVKLVPGYQLLTISESCFIESDNNLLTPINQWWVTNEVQVDIGMGSIDPTAGINTQIIPTPVIASQSRIKLMDVDLGTHDDFIALNNSFHSLSESTKTLKEQSKSWIDRSLDLLKFQDNTWTDMWNAIPFWFFLIIILILVLIISLVIMRPRKHMNAMAIPMSAVGFSSLPQSAAFTLIPTSNKTLLLLTDGNLTTNEIFSTIYDHVGINHWFMYIMGMLMVIMLICHFSAHIQLSKQTTMILQRLAWQTGSGILNIKSFHHIGEVRVLATVNLIIKSLGGKPLIHQVTIQITTLPRPLTQWYLKENLQPRYAIKTNKNWRWQSMLTFSIDWEKFCILSKLYPQVDTCQEMPQICSIPIHDILLTCPTLKHILWYNIEAVSISHVEVRVDDNSAILYSTAN